MVSIVSVALTPAEYEPGQPAVVCTTQRAGSHLEFSRRLVPDIPHYHSLFISIFGWFVTILGAPAKD